MLNMYKKRIRENKNYLISTTTKPIDNFYWFLKALLD